MFTGSIDGFTRRELTNVLERHGANLTGSVSGATDYLVVGENPGQRKQDQAAEHDVPTLDPRAFREEVLDRLPADAVPE